MEKRKWFTLVLTLALLVSALTACGGLSQTAVVPEADKERETALRQAIESARGRTEDIKADYEWNKSRTFVVGKVVYHSYSDGWDNKGNYAKGFPKEGIKTIQLRLDADKYYNYKRLWDIAEADKEACYCYFRIGLFNWNGGKYRAETNKSSTEPAAFNGLITDEYLEELKRNGQRIEFIFDIDREYQHMAEEGDTLLLAVDAQLTYNGNYFTEGMKDRVVFPKWYNSVVAPFNADHPQPYIAHFIDGKLQLPAELEDAFALRRLYDDTDPELTGIKDGDAIEDVVAFLKAVEHDMIRYEEEMRQQPITTDVSSIR